MRQRKLASGLGLLVAVAASLPVLAFAQASTPAPYPACTVTSVPTADSERAHTIYSAGKVQYDDGNYDAAIAQFREAYKRDCTKHDLLVIISRAYELKGDKAEAINALQTYLDRVPGSPDATAHKARIENMKRQLASQPPPTATPTATPSSTSTPPPPPPGERQEHTAYPWVVVAIGGAAVLTGVILLVAAPPFPAGCNKDTSTCTPDPAKNETSDSDSFKNRQSKAGDSTGLTLGGTIAIIGGVGIAAGGLLWHFLEPTSGSPPSESGKLKPKLKPEAGPGYAGLTLGGAF